MGEYIYYCSSVDNKAQSEPALRKLRRAGSQYDTLGDLLNRFITCRTFLKKTAGDLLNRLNYRIS